MILVDESDYLISILLLSYCAFAPNRLISTNGYSRMLLVVTRIAQRNQVALVVCPEPIQWDDVVNVKFSI